MSLGKQAKTLSKGQSDAMLAYLSTTRYPERNRLIFRAKEIARLTVTGMRPPPSHPSACARYSLA